MNKNVYSTKCHRYFKQTCEFFGYEPQRKPVLGFGETNHQRCCVDESACKADLKSRRILLLSALLKTITKILKIAFTPITFAVVTIKAIVKFVVAIVDIINTFMELK